MALHGKDYEEACRQFHRKRIEKARDTYDKVIHRDVANMTDEDWRVISEAVQYYLRKTQ